MATERVPNLEGLVEVGGGGNGRNSGKVEQIPPAKEYQHREYVLFLTDGKEELKVAADHLREWFDNLKKDEEPRYVLQQVADVSLAVEFWRKNPLSVPLIIVDKRTPNSPGSILKLMHSEVDPKIITGVVNAYTSRTEEGIVPQGTIDSEKFVRTIVTELGEMHERRKTELGALTSTQRSELGNTLVRSIETYLPLYDHYLRDGIEPQDEEAQKLAMLASPGMKLSMVIQTFKEHHGKRNPNSQEKVSAAASILKTLLKDVPPGIVYITLAEKEGIFAHEAALAGDTQTVHPAYIVKRFERLQHARHVHLLSQWIQRDRETRQSQGDIVYLQTPQTYWPSNVDGFSVLFMDPVLGEDLLTLLPKINSEIEGGSEEAGRRKNKIITASLDNIAYWQHISPQAAKEIGGYAASPSEIRRFIERAIEGSRRTLETVTDANLSNPNKLSINQAGTDLSSLVGENPAFGFDSGVKNIRVQGESRTLADIANALWHVDIPYEWRTVHRMRDVVRLLFAPATGLNAEEINRNSAYFILRGEYLEATGDEATRPERARLEQQIDLVLNQKGQAMLPALILEGRGVYQDLYAVAAAEAARMTRIITQVFLSKVAAAQIGEIRTTLSQNGLREKFEELTIEYQKWAQTGLMATYQLGETLDGETGEKIVRGLETLFNAWKVTHVNPDKLQHYQQFMKV